MHLEVEDIGPGVAPENETKLFQPFFTTKPVGEGTGLGLSVSYGIIHSLGGEIGYRRGALGGALFHFSVPAVGDSQRQHDRHRLYLHRPAAPRIRRTCRCRATRPADRFEAVLDRTAFYPTSGGQPSRHGTLGGARVLDVIDDDDGEIRHVLDAPITPVRSRPRRDRLAAPASITCSSTPGQHILSAAFDRLLRRADDEFPSGRRDGHDRSGARGHARRRSTTRRPRPNRVVWENRPVSVRFVTEEEAAGAAASQGAGADRRRCGWSRSRTSTCRRAAAPTCRRPA